MFHEIIKNRLRPTWPWKEESPRWHISTRFDFDFSYYWEKTL